MAENDDANAATLAKTLSKATKTFVRRVHEVVFEPPPLARAVILSEFLAYAATWIEEAAGPMDGLPSEKGIVAYRGRAGWRYAVIPVGPEHKATIARHDFLAYQLDAKGNFTLSGPAGAQDVVQALAADHSASDVLETASASIPETLAEVRDALKASAKKLRAANL